MTKYQTSPTLLDTPLATPLPYLIGDNGSERQARFFDISFWARTGGTDWVRAKQNFDGVIIRAGQGFYGYDELLPEHIEKAAAVELPAHVYWQIDPRANIYLQADKLMKGPGCRGKKKCIAWERTGGGLSTWADVKAMADYIRDAEPDTEVYIYCRINIMREAGLSTKNVAEFNWLIAQYPYEDYYKETLYTRFDAYLEDHAYEYPADIERYNLYDWEPYILLHQFTSKLDAQYYFANQYTDDPVWRNGLKSGDGIVSMQPASEAIAWFTNEPAPDPDPEPDPEDPDLAEIIAEIDERLTEVEQVVYILSEAIEALENRVTVLEQQAHDHGDEPDPEPDEDYILVEITEQHPPYYYKGTDQSCPDPQKGKPDMLRREGLDPFTVGQQWVVNAQLALSCHDNAATPRITGADGRKYYRIASEGDYRGRFILADKAQKVE